MDSFLSFANIVKKVFQVEHDAVQEVNVENYVHHEILAREDSLILHRSTNELNKVNYELVLHRENQVKTAFSIYRSPNSEEAEIQYLLMKDKLPEFSRLFPHLATVSIIQDICKYVRNHPTQNLAQICSYFGYLDYFKQLQQLSGSPKRIGEIIDHRDENGKTSLFIAIESQRVVTVQAILALKPRLDVVDNRGNNVLHVAAQTTPEIINIICTRLNEISSDYDDASDEMGNVDGESVSTEPSTSDAASGTSKKIRTTSSEEVEDEIPYLLLKFINYPNKSNFTPLYLACFNDKPDCVKELLKNGANVNGASICDHGGDHQTSKELTKFDDHRIMNQLNVKDMKNGGTPLHWCKSVETLEILIDKQCNLNAKNFHGDTALHTMINRNNLLCVISLLSHGAKVNAIGANGNTPLHLAIKMSDVSLVQACIVFGADLNLLNSSGESPRHLASIQPRSVQVDNILYILNSVCAARCSVKRANCNEGCLPECAYNGVPPKDSSIPSQRQNKLFDELLMDNIVKRAIDEKLADGDQSTSSNNIRSKGIKLLSLDGGGIRGLIILQMLAHFELVLGKPVAEMFDYIAGTSTGGIIALLLNSGYSATKCREIYFRFKDKIFVGMRPYSSETLEAFLQQYLGKESRMCDFNRCKVMIPTTVCDRFPPEVKFFRNYPCANSLLSHPYKHDPLPDLDTQNELVWKVARASGAAPTYFSQFESFVDGGLISNNPTLDLLTEYQNLKSANEMLGRHEELQPIDLVLSLGTGAIPKKPLEIVNFQSIFSLTSLTNFVNLIKVLVEQATQADGQVVERAQAWCSMIKVPFFRINPTMSEDIQMDESNNVKLVNMLWETMVYMQIHTKSMDQLMALLK